MVPWVYSDYFAYFLELLVVLSDGGFGEVSLGLGDVIGILTSGTIPLPLLPLVDHDLSFTMLN